MLTQHTLGEDIDLLCPRASALAQGAVFSDSQWKGWGTTLQA